MRHRLDSIRRRLEQLERRRGRFSPEVLAAIRQAAEVMRASVPASETK